MDFHRRGGERDMIDLNVNDIVFLESKKYAIQ